MSSAHPPPTGPSAPRFPGDDGRTGTRTGRGDRGVEHVARAADEWRWPLVIAWCGGLVAYLTARALHIEVSAPELGIGAGGLTVLSAMGLAFRVVRLVKSWSGVERQVGAVQHGQQELSSAMDDRLRAMDERVGATGHAVLTISERLDERTGALERRLDVLLAASLGPDAVAELRAGDLSRRGRRREDTGTREVPPFT